MKIASCISLVALAILTGCGGGGGGSSANTPVTITAANYEEIAESGLDSGLSAGALAGNTSNTAGSILGGVEVGPAKRVGLAKLALNMARYSLAKVPSSPAVAVVGAVTSFSESCDVSGTFSGSATLQVAGSYTVGDNISVTFSQCNDGESVTSGSVAIRIDAFEGDPLNDNLGRFAFTITLQNFLADGSTIDGSMSIDSTQTLTIYSLDVGIPSLSIIAASERSSFSNFELSIESNSVANTSSFEMMGTFYSLEIGGSLTFSTTTPVVMNNNDGTITSGVIVITGANNGKIRVSSNGTNRPLVEADLNGDGIFELNSRLSSSESFGDAVSL